MNALPWPPAEGERCGWVTREDRTCYGLILHVWTLCFLVQPCWINTNERVKCFWKPPVTYRRNSNLPTAWTGWCGEAKGPTWSKWKGTDLPVMSKWWMIARTRPAWANWEKSVRTQMAQVWKVNILMWISTFFNCHSWSRFPVAHLTHFLFVENNQVAVSYGLLYSGKS